MPLLQFKGFPALDVADELALLFNLHLVGPGGEEAELGGGGRGTGYEDGGRQDELGEGERSGEGREAEWGGRRRGGAGGTGR